MGSRRRPAALFVLAYIVLFKELTSATQTPSLPLDMAKGAPPDQNAAQTTDSPQDPNYLSCVDDVFKEVCIHCPEAHWRLKNECVDMCLEEKKFELTALVRARCTTCEPEWCIQGEGAKMCIHCPRYRGDGPCGCVVHPNKFFAGDSPSCSSLGSIEPLMNLAAERCQSGEEPANGPGAKVHMLDFTHTSSELIILLGAGILVSVFAILVAFMRSRGIGQSKTGEFEKKSTCAKLPAIVIDVHDLYELHSCKSTGSNLECNSFGREGHPDKPALLREWSAILAQPARTDAVHLASITQPNAPGQARQQVEAAIL